MRTPRPLHLLVAVVVAVALLSGTAAVVRSGSTAVARPASATAAAARAITTHATTAHATTAHGTVVRRFQYAGTDDPFQSLTATWDPARHGAPWIVTIHGGSWVKGSPADLQPAVDVFRAAGFQVFDIGYRFVTDRDGVPGVPWNDERGDVQTAVDWVRAHAARFGADPDRGALYGSSAGGQLALTVGLTGDGAPGDAHHGIRAIVSNAGVSEPDRLWQDLRGEHPDEPATPERIDLAGWADTAMRCPDVTVPTSCAQRWRAFEPASRISPHDPPVALYQGLADATVPFQMAQSFRAALDRAGVGGYLRLVPGLGHTRRLTIDGGARQAALVRWLLARTVKHSLNLPSGTKLSSE